MARDVEIGRALAAIAATLNDQKLEHFEMGRVQKLVNDALGGARLLTVDGGGGVHDDAGTRVGAIRRTPSGEWITERQNESAERADAPIPREPEGTGLEGPVSKVEDRI